MTKTIIRRPINAIDINPSPLLNRIYAARGILAADHLERGLENLISFNQLLNIETAVTLLEAALQEQRHIIVIGDFDADGATSTALAVSALKTFGLQNISYLVPNRFEYGYGLTKEIVAVAAQSKPHLIITVDNGISNHDGVAAANELGIKVLITDHHLPGAELPAAAAIINPNQAGDNFSSKCIAGVGVIFYLMLALRSRLREINWFVTKNIPEPNMAQFLDLVALGTVADVVMLDKNNRILVHQGLQRIRNGKVRPGIRALLEVAGRMLPNLTANDLGFAAGPRLNAAGRLEDMSLGIECLLCADANKARDIAMQLDALNKERQAIEENMQQQAYQILNKMHFEKNLPFGICLFDESWHQGVIGILASRVKDQFNRPVIAFACSNANEIKGSARSISGVHIRDVLADIAVRYPNLIIKFGGHAMAAGLSLRKENYAEFVKIFAAEIQHYLDAEAIQGKIYTDGELMAHEFNLEIAALLRDGGPWGQGFPEPMFDGIFKLIEQRLVGQKHLKMTLLLDENTGEFCDAIAFNVDLKAWPNHRCEKIRAAYRLDINEFRNLKKLQLIVDYLEAC